MTLSELATYICNLVGKTDSTSLARCKEYIRQHHQLIYDSALWRESLIVERVTMQPYGGVTHIEVTGGGSGYTSAPTISFSAGGAGYVAPTATAKTFNNDTVGEILLTKTGSGYTENPIVTFTGGGGSGATAKAYATGYNDELTLPQSIQQVLAITADDQELRPEDIITQYMCDPSALTESGTASSFSPISSVGINFDLLNGSLYFDLADSADAGKKVEIVGKLWGDPTRIYKETLTLAASPSANASFEYYSVITSLTKETTADTVTVRNSTSTEKFYWYGWETRAEFQRVKLYRRPEYDSTGPVQLVVLGKQKIRPMIADTDGPMISGIDNALIKYGTADMLKRARQYGKAQLETAEGDRLLAVARDAETNQTAKIMRIVPDAYTAGYNRNDFGF